MAQTPRRRPAASSTRTPGAGAQAVLSPEGELSRAFVRDVMTDWTQHGAGAIASVRAERPHDYLKLVTSLFPKEAAAKANAFEELSDEQLAARLAAVLHQLAAGSTGAGAGTGTPEAPQPDR